MEFLKDLVVILSITLLVGFLLKRVGVPIIAGFIVAGIATGPFGIKLVQDPSEVEVLAEIGVALLLFTIGLELSLEKLKRLWKAIVVGGGIQVTFTMFVTIGISRWANFSWNQSIFFGFLLALSSTAIVLRGLQSKGALHSPYGQFSLGVLVFQDICVIPMMLAVPLLASSQTAQMGTALGDFTLSVVFCILILFGGRLFVPRILKAVARVRERELFVLTVLLACLSMALLAYYSGASFALGAFLAGMVVSGTRFRDQALLDLLPFREVFVSVFFLSIGMFLNPYVLFQAPLVFTLLFLSIVLGKFTIVFFAAILMKLPLRIAMLSGLILAQVGEFSFVIANFGLKHALIERAQLDLFLGTAIPSMLITPLIIKASPHIVASASQIRWLNRLFNIRGVEEISLDASGKSGHVVIAGFGITGQRVAQELESVCDYVIVDSNVDNVDKGAVQGQPIYFGDVTRHEVLQRLELNNARAFIVAINDADASSRAVRMAKEINPGLCVLVRGQYELDRSILESAGADAVVIAEAQAADRVAMLVRQLATG